MATISFRSRAVLSIRSISLSTASHMHSQADRV